jgi:hypothetical protein
MRLQSFTKKEAINLMKLAIVEDQRRRCRSEDMDYYAFPKEFPSTHGPFAKVGAIAGSSITTYTIEVWHNKKFDIALFFCGDTPIAMVPDFSVKKIETDYTKNNILHQE